ncbi:PDC sensor domain-containing protein [Marinobacter bryozoorum]|uniref:PDC sensor domain-containing protein n=1 Tax=Marinobacter bryozoorum TaxID=256324 RepID=UPI0020036568|nr:PDC sensor domain-containing protein [Marinobacter bryozoorum]MCK7546021.1 PDC sensor domain-containing protein [Marinobacter bryozoorum]
MPQAMTEKAAEVSQNGANLHTLADELLTSIGTFRFDAHRMARSATKELTREPAVFGLTRLQLEPALKRALNRHDFFELFYVTDMKGQQISDNMASDGFTAGYGGTGFGHDWSDRDWFRRTSGDGETWVTPVYRSAATGGFCFTVASPIRDRNGKVVAILGADVSLENCIRGARRIWKKSYAKVCQAFEDRIPGCLHHLPLPQFPVHPLTPY